MRTCAACGTETDDDDCPDCDRAIVDAPDVEIVADDPEYGFEGTAAAERVEASELLRGAGIPFRWDAGYTLRVPADREEAVDALFGHGSSGGALEELRDAAATLLADWDRIDIESTPTDEIGDSLVIRLADAVGVVTMSAAPDDVHPLVWATAGFVARQLMASVDGGDPDTVAMAAQLALAVLDMETD